MNINKNTLYIFFIMILAVSSLIGYSYINNDINFTSNVTVNKYDCNQSNLYDRLSCMSIIDNVKSKYVSNNLGISFTNISSNTNGNGIYRMASTEADTYPISYYRGAVENNNIKFGGFCWLIVRTTSTGGTKLIYNGLADANGHCTTTGVDSTIGSSSYSYSDRSPTYVGYMYDDTYPVYDNTPLESGHLIGSDVDYINGRYYLINPTSDISLLNSNHYTCFSSTDDNCETVSYINLKTASNTIHIELKNGTKISTAFAKMFENTKDSNIKSKIEKWFEDNLLDYESKLEDTIFCNDRSIPEFIANNEFASSGWFPNGGNTNRPLIYNTYIRIINNNSPSLDCQLNDSFTKNQSNGNGKLKYEIGLLTIDEIVMAGGKKSVDNPTIYLNNNTTWYTMSPFIYGNSYVSRNFIFGDTGSFEDIYTVMGHRIRPSISLNHSQVISSGDGTKNNPYVIN